MTDAKKQVAATIERAKADLDLALADLDKITAIDPKTFSYCAHALNNYLMVAAAATELLGVSLAGHPDDQVRIWTEGLRHAINLMTHSVRRMMNESNGQEAELKFEKVDSALLIFRVCNFYQRKAEWKKIKINCEAEPDLPLAWMDAWPLRRSWTTCSPMRFDRLGVSVEARGVLVPREGQSLLLEVEAPVAKGPHVAELYERWVARHAGSAPPRSSRNGLPPRVRIAKGAEALSALARGAGSGYRLGP